MEMLALLSDDHALLSSDVLRLVALVRAFAEGRFGRTHLHCEIRRQSNVLRGQLTEHFDFEESTAFPHLASTFPDAEPQLRRLIQDHDRVMETFETFRTELELCLAPHVAEALLQSVLAFEHAFKNHATDEIALFEKLSEMLETANGS